MKPYRVYIWADAAEVLRVAPAGQRLKLIAFIDSLARDPFILGDYTETDETNRDIQIKVVGTFAIAFWADHAVGEVKVVELRRADK